MLIAMSVFGWLAWTSRSEQGIGHSAGVKPSPAQSSSLTDDDYELLAQFSAPVYKPQRADSKPFQAAMASYQHGDYAAAASALRTVSNASPALIAPKFYLGIALLLSGDRISGIQELRDITDAEDNAYTQPARYFLAKGLISERDIRRAREQLQQVIEQHGDFEKEAAALLAKIQSG